MKSKAAIAAALGVVLGSSTAGAEVSHWRLGGLQGLDWETQTLINLMVDNRTIAGAIQPLELKPDVNVVTQLRHWTRYREPIDIRYREGMPRVWRDIGDVARPGHVSNPMDFIDGNITTYYEARDFEASGGRGGIWGEFYTLDMGLQVPAERFVLVPPEGKDPYFLEPYRPNYLFKSYELTASNDPILVETQVSNECVCGPDYYQPLDIALASVGQNFDAVIEVKFPLQYLRFFRMRLLPDTERRFTRYALAELQVYGRGFVPRARWQSQVIDLGEVVNIGQVQFGLSKWRRQDGQSLEAPGAQVGVKVEIRSGLDDTPIAYHTYNDMAQPVEVDEATYSRLKPRVWPWDPPAVGWQGPIIEDRNNWSFWSPPVRQSGLRTRVPHGRYIQVQVELETETQWEYARLDSLSIEISPLLAERVVAELAAVDNLRPVDNLVQIQAGQPTEFVYEVRADFSSNEQSGFDAMRLLTPSPGSFLGLEMGSPLAALEPDSVVMQANGFAIYLPERVGPDGPQRLRLRLETAVYGASGEIGAEVFNRMEADLLQGVEGGDASEELSTNQLRVVAVASSIGSVLADMVVSPAVFTPQGDGINDQAAVDFTLFRVLKVARVEADVFTLNGQRVRRLPTGVQTSGRYRVIWNGRSDDGQLVEPGLYLVRVGVDTDEGRAERIRPIAIVY